MLQNLNMKAKNKKTMKTININKILFLSIFFLMTLHLEAMNSIVKYDNPQNTSGSFNLLASDCTQSGWSYYFEITVGVQVLTKIDFNFGANVFAYIRSNFGVLTQGYGPYSGTGSILSDFSGKIAITISGFGTSSPYLFNLKFSTGSYSAIQDSYIHGNSIVDGNIGVGTLIPNGNLDVEGTTFLNNNNILKSKTLSIQNSAMNPSGNTGIYSNIYNPSASVCGIYSTVSGGGSLNQRWAGYFSGGDVEVSGGNLKVSGNSYLAGNVGVGTTAPTQALNVVGRIGVSPSGTRSDEGYNGGLMITKPIASGQYINLVRSGIVPWSIGTVYNSSTFAIGLGKSPDDKFTNPFFNIDTNGNLGVGTTTPNAKIESVSGVNAFPAVTGTIQSGSALRLRGGDNAVLDFGMNSINTWIQATDQNNLGLNYNISLNPNGGNVAIGTKTASEKLTVAGGHTDTKIRLSSTGNGSDQPANLSLWASEPGVTYYGTGIGYNVNGSPYYGRLDNTRGSSYIRFLPGETKFQFQNTAGSNIDALTIKENGFVGIGIGSGIPDQLLTVNGTIHAKEIIVTVDVPSDFVFNTSYKLMPLNEVEKYVTTNSHLPEIPSAAEIKKNGLSMGEMQNKLLQKVEELTLYMIDQQKIINMQSAQISQQNTKIENLEKKLK